MDPIVFIDPDTTDDLQVVLDVVDECCTRGYAGASTTEVMILRSSVVLAKPQQREQAEALALRGRRGGVSLRLVDSVPLTLEYFGGSDILRAMAGLHTGVVTAAPISEQELADFMESMQGG